MTLRVSSLQSAVGLALLFCGCSDDRSSPSGADSDSGGSRADAAPATGGATSTGGSSTTGGAGGSGPGSGGRAGNDAGSSGGAPSDASFDSSMPSAGGSSDGATLPPEGGLTETPSFFVTSDTSPTGDLGGLDGADVRCQSLAEAAGYGDRTWRAYLSADGNPAVNARDRIGEGPWFNVRGVLVAQDLDSLHSRTGDPDVFLDENGRKINGQWANSPTPNEHDILTGSDGEGNVLEGMNCDGWTSDSADSNAQVGHSDGLGPSMNANPPFSSWHSSHGNMSCADTSPFGGSGRIYCFAI